MRAFTLSIAHGVRQNPKNKIYSTQATITSLDELAQAVQYDYVAGLFKNNERSNNNFIEADCIIMDCDNNHTDKPELWLTPEKLAERLHDVEFVIAYSRNHMKDKKENDGSIKTARPRFHAHFALSETVNKAARIRELKELLIVLVPEFDAAAKDAARFIYGVETPQGTFNEGSLCVDEFLAIEGVELPEKNSDTTTASIDTDTETDKDTINTTNTATDNTTEGTIPIGERHGYLMKVAFEALSKYPESKAREIFDKACARCKPLLPIEEISRIWTWTAEHVKAYKDSVKERQKKVLTLPIIEQTLQELNISVQFNVITKEFLCSELPLNNEHVPASYYKLHGLARSKNAAEILPFVLATHFKSKNYGVSESFITGAISAIANANPLNPVLEMLNSTTWDGHNRIYELAKVLGIQERGYENDMYRIFLEKWLLQAVAIALNDDGDIGNEFVLILQGKQGLGKTNFFKALAMRHEWFREGVTIDMRNKDTYIEATECWIAELGELDSTLKKEQASLKAFITRNFDTYRRPYARKADKVERRTAFCGTVNPAQVIRDDTGGRRYVIIHVDNIDKTFIYRDMTPQWCAQLWRQVYETKYLMDAKGFYLNDSERAFVDSINENFTVELECESELRDSLAWCVDDNTTEDAPIEEYAESWTWRTISELKKHTASLDKLDARKIGRAITRIIQSLGLEPEKYSRRVRGTRQYKLPQTRFY